MRKMIIVAHSLYKNDARYVMKIAVLEDKVMD